MVYLGLVDHVVIPFGLLFVSLATAHAPQDVQNASMSCAMDVDK